MSDHPARGTQVPTLMRKPEECSACHHWHLSTEACPIPVICYSCGAPTGLYDWGDGNGLRQCQHCFRERVDG